jgi:peptidoglycan hydrolase-like protein with peptidoglycan-binding domain
MRKYGFIILALVLSIYFLGCGKKQQSLEEMQAPMSIESLSTITTEATTMPETKVAETKPKVTQTTPEPTLKAETTPPAGPYKPTSEQIQIALKNAGYYTGPIDSKIGPMSKKAIEEFQKANNLQVDGKVGPKTWQVLSKYLNTAPTEQSKKR